MKTVILCGGMGTRLAEETAVKPKPMIEVGGLPILWHIMKIYAAQGFTEFVLALGYKGDVIKDFFVNYLHRSRSVSVDMRKGQISVHHGISEDWMVHLLDTGMTTQTGGRIRQAAEFIGPEPFMMTYGDGVSDVDLERLCSFHRGHGCEVTVTAVRPPARFGSMKFDGDRVTHFAEKPQVGEGWINGGFFVVQPEAVRRIGGNDTLWEQGPMEDLAQSSQLMAYRHTGFWQCMDTLRDVRMLEELWNSGSAPWKRW